MKKLIPLFTALLLFSSCDKENEQKTNTARYNVQTISVMGAVMICQVTDNDKNRTYVYHMKDTYMELKAVIDLSKVGDKTIPFAVDNLGEKVETSRSKIDIGKDFKLATKASLTLKKVNNAQMVYLAGHPTESVSSLTASKLIPYLPDNLTDLPTAQALDGSVLSIKVSVSPPVFIDENGLDYDPSGDSADGLWDLARPKNR